MRDKNQSIEQIWDELASVFSNWRGVRPRRHWFTTGFSERLGPARMRRLEGGEDGRRFFQMIENCSVNELEYLHRRAVINFEQVSAAARLAIIMNITSVIAMFVLINQLFPGSIGGMIASAFTGNDAAFAGGLIAFIFVSLFILTYCLGGINMARDLKHLLELALARRKISPTDKSYEDALDVTAPLSDTLLDS